MFKFKKHYVGRVAALLAMIGMITLTFLILGVIDLHFLTFNESALRLITQFIVLNLLIAAWAYWEI